MIIRRSLAVAGPVAMMLLANGLPASANMNNINAAGPYVSSVYSCGSKYPSGHTSGYVRVRVTVAGSTNSNVFSYPGGTVSVVGTSHSGTVTSYADTRISSWGFNGCVAGI